jgi:glycine cleavage system H protein
MKAGVLSYWLCPRDFDCEHCVLDRILSGRDPVDLVSDSDRDRGTDLYPIEAGPLSGLGVPLRRRRGLWYHPLHLWGRAAGPTRVRLGLDDISARLLANAEPWAMPPLGATLGDGRPLARTRVNGVDVQIASPAPGRVLARNEALRHYPALAAWSPYEAGWLVELALEAPLGALSGFMGDEDIVSHWFAREVERVAECAPLWTDDPSGLGETLADGGTPCATLSEALGPEGLRAALALVFPRAGHAR